MVIVENQLVQAANPNLRQKARPFDGESKTKKGKLRKKAGAVLLAVGTSAVGAGIAWKYAESANYWWNELKIESSSKAGSEKASGREKREETHQTKVDVAHNITAAGAIPLSTGCVLWFPEMRRAVVRKLKEINDNSDLTS